MYDALRGSHGRCDGGAGRGSHSRHPTPYHHGARRTHSRAVHRLFAQNFEQYVQWCDKVDLYDNNDDSPVLIASKHTRDDGLEVLHAAKYEMFQFNVHINENCKGPEDIFKVAPPTQSSTDTPWECDRGCLLEGLFKGIERDQ